MARYPKKAAYRTFVIDSQTGKWKQIEIKDIPEEKLAELCDNFALGAGYERAKALSSCKVTYETKNQEGELSLVAYKYG